MKFIVSESFLNIYKRLLSEQDEIDLDEYDREDFIEVFFEYFRPWVKSKHGEDIGRYPLSALLKKYFSDFAKEIGYKGRYQYDDDDEIEYWGTSQLEDIGRKFVELGKHSLPSLKPNFKFTERYERQINLILKQMKLPEWLTFSFEETTPFNVKVILNVDFMKMMESSGDSMSAKEYFDIFEEKIESVMGIEMGNPAYGGLRMVSYENITNVDKFGTPQFQKELKNIIKSVDTNNIIHSVGVSPSKLGLHLNIKFKGHSRYSVQREVNAKIREKLQNLGYNITKIIGI